jgi:hypothetical protein
LQNLGALSGRMSNSVLWVIWVFFQELTLGHVSWV